MRSKYAQNVAKILICIFKHAGVGSMLIQHCVSGLVRTNAVLISNLPQQPDLCLYTDVCQLDLWIKEVIYTICTQLCSNVSFR